MNTYIGIRLQVEGIHQWSGVTSTSYAQEVGYLQFPHRHIFHIDCRMKVNHNDRDKEFIATKHEIMSYLRQEFWSTHDGLCNFGEMSCETIAHLLIEKFGLTSCEVSEDGENYAYVEA